MHPALVYIAVSLAASTAETWIGSLSEYRFPYPLTTTQLHLALSIGIVSLGTSLSRICETGESHLSAQPETASDDSKAPSRNAAHPSDQRASPLSSAPLGPRSTLGSRLAIVLCWSSLLAIETTSRLRIDPSFWSLVRLAPLATTFMYTAVSPSRRRHLSKWHLLSLALLMRSWQDAWTSSSYQDWLVGAAWTVAAVTWGVALRCRHRTTEENAPLEHRLDTRVKASSATRADRLLVDLVTYAVVASAAAGLSSEWTAIVRYRHFGFFTEVGFWLQELGMATCGLARLAAFYMMAENYDALDVFAAIAVKDSLHPLALGATSGRPLQTMWSGDALVSDKYQMAALVVLAGGAASWKLWSPGRLRDNAPDDAAIKTD
ncbi:hypothetical protein B0A53_01280 [Rhodotorula sp. CCFEE 5036]|nr:hypothetical protein B0A53_01280 [Rhodotorula sp. CCFEE 5036]